MEPNAIQKKIHEQYNREHAALGEKGTLQHIEKSEQWDFSGTLREGGVLVFPHTAVQDCGYQVAACVRACLDSGADTVLVVSVLHAFTDEMEQARRRVAAGGDFKKEASWGIQGPGLNGLDNWKGDDAKTPKVIERYPYLAGGHPEMLPGIEEVQEIAKNAVIVSTADSFHHGIGYGGTPENSFYPDEAGLARAKGYIEEGLRILEKGDYWGYNVHCVEKKSDARDAGQVYRYLRGPISGQVVDLTYSDATDLYDSPPPTWVAAALTEWKKN